MLSPKIDSLMCFQFNEEKPTKASHLAVIELEDRLLSHDSTRSTDTFSERVVAFMETYATKGALGVGLLLKQRT